jgi:hypothetical protein
MFVIGTDAPYAVAHAATSDGLDYVASASERKHYREKSPELKKLAGNLWDDHLKKDHT